jgi:hypothetical protein
MVWLKERLRRVAVEEVGVEERVLDTEAMAPITVIRTVLAMEMMPGMPTMGMIMGTETIILATRVIMAMGTMDMVDTKVEAALIDLVKLRLEAIE